MDREYLYNALAAVILFVAVLACVAATWGIAQFLKTFMVA